MENPVGIGEVFGQEKNNTVTGAMSVYFNGNSIQTEQDFFYPQKRTHTFLFERSIERWYFK